MIIIEWYCSIKWMKWDCLIWEYVVCEMLDNLIFFILWYKNLIEECCMMYKINIFKI